MINDKGRTYSSLPHCDVNQCMCVFYVTHEMIGLLSCTGVLVVRQLDICLEVNQNKTVAELKVWALKLRLCWITINSRRALRACSWMHFDLQIAQINKATLGKFIIFLNY